MTGMRQYYGGDGVPLEVPSAPEQVIAAWRSHRQRLRDWLGALDDAAWSGPTRCSAWDVADLARHLVSGSQFLGYTLHQASKGEATRLLEGFDPQATPGAAASMFAAEGPAQLLDRLAEMDAKADAGLDALGPDGLQAAAEAPMGQVPAYVTVNHFLFDSWVHEWDLMLPAGQTPVSRADEAAAVAAYVFALAGAAGGVEAPLRFRLTDLGRDLVVDVVEQRATTRWSEPTGELNGSGSAIGLVDLATGRAPAQPVDVDAAGSTYLKGLGSLLAG